MRNKFNDIVIAIEFDPFHVIAIFEKYDMIQQATQIQMAGKLNELILLFNFKTHIDGYECCNLNKYVASPRYLWAHRRPSDGSAR